LADHPDQPAASSQPNPSSSPPPQRSVPYQWFAAGDLNGFFGLMVDNVAVMGFLAMILVSVGFPAELVFTRMFPGTALGVMFGDLVYTWMAFRLAKKTGRSDVTAMPLGLDTPSTIGIAVTVLLPAFFQFKQDGMTPEQAALNAWYVGMGTMVLIGVIKLIFSFTGNLTQRIVPQAGLLGSLAGIGLALIGLLPMLEILSRPVVGMVALGLILYSLVAGIRLPFKIPGVAGAVAVGATLYYVFGAAGMIPYEGPGQFELHYGLPIPNLGFMEQWGVALSYLPIAFPFAILTVVGGINVTESARVGGDDYNTRDVLLVEAVATLLAGFCGGVAQSTPYIGQPAYKAVGSRAGYTLMTGLFVGIGGMCGALPLVLKVLPMAILAPILIFVALDIMVQAFQASPRAHAAAVALAYFPTVARLIQIQYDKNGLLMPENWARVLEEAAKPGHHIPETMLVVVLGNGFILTAMLWGGFMAELIDRRLKASAVYLFLLSGLSYFGIVHSVKVTGAMYNPATLSAGEARIPVEFATAYAVLGLIFLALSFTRESREPRSEHAGH
jgi:AGZA family xanthine/uracil permease-like MFS transporter